MDRLAKIIIVTFGIIASVHGHGWLIQPGPRNSTGVGSINQADKTKFCGIAGTYPSVTQIDNAGTLNVKWEIQSGHTGTTGPDTCIFQVSKTENGPFTQVAGPFSCLPGQYSKNITIFIDNADNGTFYLQFRWNAGDGSVWYNCAEVQIMYTDITINTITDGVNGQQITPSTADLYKMTIPATQYVYVSVNGPSTAGSIQWTASLNSLPTPYSNDRSVTVGTGQTTAVSFCGTTLNTTAFVGVYPDDQAAGTYSFSSTSYAAYIDFAKASYPQITDSQPNGGSKFYYYQAYTTPDPTTGPKRIVLTGPEGMGLSTPTSCKSSPTPTKTIDAGAKDTCIDVPTKQGVKYIEVTSPSPVDSYTIGIETGKCTDKSAGSVLSISFALIAMALLLSAL